MHQSLHKNEVVRFIYQLKKIIDIKSVYFLIDDGFTNKKIKPNSITIDNQSLQLEYQFNANGFYDLHLYISDDLISTYTFSVK